MPAPSMHCRFDADAKKHCAIQKVMFFDINRFHFFVLLTWQFAIFFASQQIFPIFSNYVPEWQCDDGPLSKNCTIYTTCNGTLSYPHSQFQSAALEYGWICGTTAYLASLFSQVQFAGTFSFGALSDIFGRKPVAIFTMSMGILTNFITGLAPTWQILMAIRFFVGLSVGGTLVVVCTFIMEMLLPHQRMALRAFFNWGVARLIMTLICMAFPEWRASSIACALTALPALFILIFIFPESPTWLNNKGRLEEMRAAERYIAKFAGVEYKPVAHKKVEHSKTLCEMLQTKSLHRRLFVLWTMWFVASICGYATDLNSNTISGDFFFNQIIYSILIALSKMVLVAVDTFIPGFSRRILHQGAQAVVCFCFLILFFLTMQGYSGVATLVINVTGTIFIEYTWDACYLCAVESMETSCRASATGTCSLMARVGAIIAPVLTYANVYWPPALYLAVVIAGLVNLVISYFFLVETKNVNLDSVTLHTNSSTEESAMLENEANTTKNEGP
nr:Major facilitator superfamily MFS-1 domain containing protein [Haemonchus contortus]